MSLIDSLPQDIIIDCISRVPRRDYPTLSLVSKYFRSLITSHELYARRVLLDRTDYCLYVTISKSDNKGGDVDRLCTLRHNFNSSDDHKYSLVPVSSLPRLPPHSNYVAVDSKIFVIPDDDNLASIDTLLIDCRFHTAHHVPSMPNEVGSSVYKYSSVGETCIGGYKLGMRKQIYDGVVMFLNQSLVCMFQWVYSRDTTWHRPLFMTLKADDDSFTSKAWYDNDCFLDGVSYSYDPRMRILRAMDMRHMSMFTKVVKGVELMTGDDVNISRTVVYGEKVVVFWQKEFDEKSEIWCAEIKVERDEEGELCGRVEWCGCVLEGKWITLKNSLVVKA